MSVETSIEQQEMTPYGYEWYFGIMPDSWVDTYNLFTKELNRTKNRESRESIMNRRHMFLVQCQNIMQG